MIIEYSGYSHSFSDFDLSVRSIVLHITFHLEVSYSHPTDILLVLEFPLIWVCVIKHKPIKMSRDSELYPMYPNFENMYYDRK